MLISVSHCCFIEEVTNFDPFFFFGAILERRYFGAVEPRDWKRHQDLDNTAIPGPAAPRSAGRAPQWI